MVEMVQYDGSVYAIIVYASHDQEGIEFFTDPSDGLQLGYMKRRKGYEVEPHVHIPVRRTVDYTNEVLFIRSGEVLIQFYTANKQRAGSKSLRAGDVILLLKGGHSVEFLEESVIVEVKQGPYAGDRDKERFTDPSPSALT